MSRTLGLILLYLSAVICAFVLTGFVLIQACFFRDKNCLELFFVFLLATFISFYVSGQYKINVTTQVPQILYQLVKFFVSYLLIIFSAWYLLDFEYVGVKKFLTFFIIYFIILFLLNVFYIRFLRRQKIDIPISETLVLGENQFSYQFIETIRHNAWMGFQFKSQVKPKKFVLKDFIHLLNKQNIRTVFINWDEFSMSKENEVIFRNLAEENGIKFYIISELFGAKFISGAYKLVGTFPYVRLFSFPLDKPWNAKGKRVFDVCFSLCFFIFVASWLFPILIIISITTQGFPIFFSQKRHGIDNQVFNCYKFRTMVQNKDCNDKITIKNDPRITKFGGILRRTSLDELPQFWNVLIGDMSVVGPRPHMVNQNLYYDSIISKYNFRHYVKPGITGLAQVNGFRGEIKKHKDMKNRVQSDLYYIRNWSFWLDISIIYRTIANMIRGDENAI